MAFLAAAPMAAQVISSEGTGKNIAAVASIGQSTAKSFIQGIIILICIILIVSGMIALAYGFTIGRGMVLFLGIAGIAGVIYWNKSSESLYSSMYGTPQAPAPMPAPVQYMPPPPPRPVYGPPPPPPRQVYRPPVQQAYRPQPPPPPPYQPGSLYPTKPTSAFQSALQTAAAGLQYVPGRARLGYGEESEAREDNIDTMETVADCGCGGSPEGELGEVFDPYDTVVAKKDK